MLCDINPDLINLYKILQKQADHFIAEAEALFCAHNNHENVYYDLREEFNNTEDTFRRSVLFLYLNRFGYNGLCRYNLSGKFNVPFGRYKAPYFPEKELLFFAQKSKKAQFECLPFSKTFGRARRNTNTVIYCDPPYVPISDTANFTSYATNGFPIEEQSLLAKKSAAAAFKRGIPVLVSNHDTKLTRKLYESASLSELQVGRYISQNGAKRDKVGELLALFTPADTDC